MEDRMPVRRLAQNVAGCKLADRANLVLDDDPPAFALPKRVGDDADDDVRRAARSTGGYNADRVGRIGLRDRRQRRSHGHHSERNCQTGKTGEQHLTLLQAFASTDCGVASDVW
jgi:hypothetical protein